MIIKCSACGNQKKAQPWRQSTLTVVSSCFKCKPAPKQAAQPKLNMIEAAKRRLTAK